MVLWGLTFTEFLLHKLQKLNEHHFVSCSTASPKLKDNESSPLTNKNFLVFLKKKEEIFKNGLFFSGMFLSL